MRKCEKTNMECSISDTASDIASTLLMHSKIAQPIVDACAVSVHAPKQGIAEWVLNIFK